MNNLENVKKQFLGQSCQFNGILSLLPSWMATQKYETDIRNRRQRLIMESFFSVSKKEFIKVSHINNQPWTEATLLIKERGQFLICLGSLINWFHVIWCGFYSTKTMSCFCACRKYFYCVAFISDFAPLHPGVKTCSDTGQYCFVLSWHCYPISINSHWLCQ